jgi:GDP-4-dehydro-6-deoxy-D-mannose reductase
MKESILITGINGFVGEHVAREFKNRGYKVTGLGHDSDANDKVKSLVDSYVSCDLLDENSVNERVSFDGMIAVIHLAGLANVGESFDQPQKYMTANGVMTHNLLSKALGDNMAGRVVVVSTGALYNPNQPLPLSESSKTAANSPYAVGKLMVEDVVEYYRSRGFDATIARPFNHIGPGQGQGFLLPDLYEQLISSTDSKIHVGNLETKRDYTDVRDIARAYGVLALAPALSHPIYNICSGAALSGNELLEILQQKTETMNIEVIVDKNRIRPNDIPEIVGDSSRIKKELGWSPTYKIDQTVADFVSFQSA